MITKQVMLVCINVCAHVVFLCVETHLSGQNMHGDHMTISLAIAEYRTLVAAVRGKHITYGQARQQ